MFTLGSDKYPGLAKLIEECAELQTILAKLITTGGEDNYWSGRDLRKDLKDELADVKCAIVHFIETGEFSDHERSEIDARAFMKLDRYRRWSSTDPSDDRSG